jgi:hypothetical protein
MSVENDSPGNVLSFPHREPAPDNDYCRSEARRLIAQADSVAEPAAKVRLLKEAGDWLYRVTFSKQPAIFGFVVKHPKSTSWRQRAPTAPTARVADVLITNQLRFRNAKPRDHLKEKHALHDVAEQMVDDPEAVLRRLVDLAIEITGAMSAGLSILEPDPAPGIFRWKYLRGALTALTVFHDATTPRYYSPCGVALDTCAPVLSAHPERFYSWIAEAKFVVPEMLLVPLHVAGKEPLGTLWIMASEAGHFDSGHAEAMMELASFVGLALRASEKNR